MEQPVDLSADYIDVRDVIKRFEELEGVVLTPEDAALVDRAEGVTLGELTDADLETLSSEIDLSAGSASSYGWAECNEEAEEFVSLRKMLESVAGMGGDEEWREVWYPVTFIRDDEFENYAREFAEDAGFIKDDMQWPADCIDWTLAAERLQQDFSSVEIADNTYWFR